MFRLLGHIARAAIVPATLAVFASASPAPAAAQEGASPWEPWIGCWDRIPRESDATLNSARLCVLPSQSPNAVDLVSVVGDSVTGREHLDATAAPRRVQQGDCEGTESVHATGTRVYRRTSLTCGSRKRLVNTLMAINSHGEWLDVRGVAVGSNVGVQPSRYRATSPSIALPPEVAAALRGRPQGMSAARIAASGPVELDDVVEASRYLEVGVLQTWLAERGEGFDLDARQLLALQKAGVSTEVIDVMVALSYPDQFALDRTRVGEGAPDMRVADMYGGGYYDGPYGYDPYGYGYGYGYGGWYSGRRPIVVVPRGSGSSDEPHGQVVKGRGYVAPRGDTQKSGGSADKSGGSASSGGSKTDKSTSTGRKAKPKP